MKNNTKRLFALKTAFFCAVGFSLTLGLTTWVDSQLHTGVAFGPRCYPLGYLILFVGPILFIGIYLCSVMPKSWKYKIFWPLLFFASVGCLCFFNFLPEFPHGAIGSWLLFYIIASLISMMVHYVPIRNDIISETKLSPEVKIAWIKETITLWRTIMTTFIIGYLALLVSWSFGIWSSDYMSMYVTDQHEKFLLAAATGYQIAFFSVYFFVGPTWELFRRTTKTIGLLLNIS